ncbi:hypothetical protein O4H50_21240 [Vibrio diazotrophicus]|uniref:DUF6966 domain-containing protein n=1 Tax=Vibrio diazotrophicus TaxID=685 RepID=UPI0022AFC242|nr:hypothetical protein [Vibrio diazotrophicus]MCZ4374317.1 hypothetical protein [Vibrio diazotrophicus]
MASRKSELKRLILALEHLCVHLRLDDKCVWTAHFEQQLICAQQLDKNGFTQADLNELSSSVRSVYGGMGSFNDYYNPNYSIQRSLIIKQLGSSPELSSRVYEFALDLMVV